MTFKHLNIYISLRLCSVLVCKIKLKLLKNYLEAEGLLKGLVQRLVGVLVA